MENVSKDTHLLSNPTLNLQVQITYLSYKLSQLTVHLLCLVFFRGSMTLQFLHIFLFSQDLWIIRFDLYL